MASPFNPAAFNRQLRRSPSRPTHSSNSLSAPLPTLDSNPFQVNWVRKGSCGPRESTLMGIRASCSSKR